MDSNSSLPVIRDKRRWRQFSLATLLITVTVLSVVFARWFWQPFPPSSSAYSGPILIDARFVPSILRKYPSGSGSDQTQWVILDDKGLAEISMNQRPNKLGVSLDDPETEELCFRATSGLGLSVHGKIEGYLYPSEAQQITNGTASLVTTGNREFTIHLHYEGKFPQGHLVFLQPLDRDTYTALAYDVIP